MPRIVKNVHKSHRLTIEGGRRESPFSLIMVRAGRPYLWIGCGPHSAMMLSGPKTLRALANAILKEVGREKGKR